MRATTLILLALAASSAEAQDAPKVTTFYRCDKDGTRSYASHLIEGADCHTINYSSTAGWTPFGSGDGITMYLREKDVVRKGNTVSFWVLDDYEEVQYAGLDAGINPYKSAIGRWSADCSEKTYWSVQITYYQDRLGGGKTMGDFTPRGQPDFRYATPGSLGELMVNAGCQASAAKSKSTPPNR